MTWVWNESRSKKNARLLLLAIADCAAEDGSNAYPSVAELMRKTGLSERGVQSTLSDLVTLGELKVFRNAGPGGCNRYRVVMTPAQAAPPQEMHPAESAPPQDLPPQKTAATPAEPAPGTVLEPSKKISSTKRSSSGPRGTRLPEPFDATAEMIAWARQHTPDIGRFEHEKFCDHFRSAPGQRGVKTNWVATWRNWMRKAQEMADSRKPSDQPRRATSDLKFEAHQALKKQIRAQEGIAST